MKDDLPRLFKKAGEQMDKYIQNISEEDLEKDSIDKDWKVRDLLNHIISEQLWLPPLLKGKTIAEVGDQFDGDLLGSDFKGAWSKAAQEVNEALLKEGALDGVAHLSYGDFPGEKYASDMLFDLIIHSFDVAKSTGQNTSLDEELVNVAWDYASKNAEEWRKAGALGEKIEVSNDASLQDRLIALSGREP